MRCHFNFVAGLQALDDEEGVEISSLDHARTEALQAIREISQDPETRDSNWGDWTLNVTDSAGDLLLSVTLEDAVSEGITALQ
jgi:hypothetical protein